MNFFDIKYWEGAFIDMWSIPHFLTGVVIALVLVLLNTTFLTGFLITLFIATGWELFEITFKIYEIPTNSIVDIILSLIAYSLFFYIPRWFSLDSKSTSILLYIMIVIFIILMILGWVAYRYYTPVE